MALIKCDNCGQMISDKAVKCPKCGCPTTKKEKGFVRQNVVQDQTAYLNKEKRDHSQKWLYGIIAALVVLLGWGTYSFLKKDKRNDIENAETKVQEQVNKDSLIVDAAQIINVNEKTESNQNILKQDNDTKEEKDHIGGIKCTLTGEIGSIQNVKMVLRGNKGKLTYIMDGKQIVSDIVLDEKASSIDKDGFGHLVLKSFAPDGKLKGRFVGEMDSAECGYYYEGEFVNVNGKSTTFLLTE